MGEQNSFVVLDTNIILLDHTNILKYSDSIVVLPAIVIREIDSKKNIQGELGYQARAFGRLLSNVEFRTSDTVIGNKWFTVTQFIISNNRFCIVTHYDKEEKFANNDEIIIDVADAFRREYNTVKFVTEDVLCRIGASAKGIKTENLKIVDKTTFSFTKEITVSSEVFSTLHRTAILDIDPEYSAENYNYIFIDEHTGQTKLGVVSNELIKIIGKETEDQLRRQEVGPIGIEQLFFSYAIQCADTDIVVCEARAGTGKTLQAISNAVAMIGKNTPYTKLVYVRASVDDVEKAEEVGFLSGNKEKMDVYFHPFYDTLDFIIRKKYKNCNKKGEELEQYLEEQKQEFMTKYNVELLTGLGMRGRTFPDSIVIIDEVQNNSRPSLQKMMTRSGNSTKYILIGSQRQIDNPYITKYNNGLSVILDEASRPQEKISIHAVELKNVIRSRLADWAESVFSKDEN